MRIRIAMGIATALLSAPASASDWWLIDYAREKPDRVVMFLDIESIKSDGPYRNVWEAQYFETPNTTFDDAKTTRLLIRYDCSRLTTDSQFLVEYDSGNGFKRSIKLASDPTPIIPDSIADSKRKIVCGVNPNYKKEAIPIGNDPDFLVNGKAFLNVSDNIKK